jgi:hypothetical protein
MASMTASPPRTSGKALAAFGLALLSFGLGLVIGVPALLLVAVSLPLCLLARRDIRRSDGRLQGCGWAKAALAGNGVSLLTCLVLLPAVAKVRETAHKMQSV